MKVVITAVVVVACAFGLAYWALGHHVVQTANGTMVLEKRFLTLDDTLVDVRRWSSKDFDEHVQLKRAMITQGYRDMLIDLKVAELKASFEEMKMEAEIKWEMIKQAIDEWINDWKPGA